MGASSSSETVTIGFKYYMGAHLALSHRLHAITRFKCGDKIAWTAPNWDVAGGGIRTNQTVYINAPNLFGGEEREGGIVGYVDILLGSGAQDTNAYLAAALPSTTGSIHFSPTTWTQWVPGTPAPSRGDPIPAFRHVASIVLNDVYVSANNPNIRPWNVEGFYQPSEGWYPATDLPGTDMGVNPAHAVRDCLTHPVWGLGYSTLDLDDASFRAVALALYNESFGISLVWETDSSLRDFIASIILHIDGVLYVDPASGLFVLKLFRDDYDKDTLPHFNETNVLSLDSYDRLSVGELANQVVLIWYDSVWDKQRSVTVHNTSVQELQGGVVSASIELPGIGNSTLANKVAARELKKLSTAFSRISFQAGRDGAAIVVGGVFKFSFAEYGLTDVIYRAGRIAYDSRGRVTIEAVEDIFSAGLSVYSDPPDTLWQDPISEPMPAPRHRATEAPYILVDRTLGHSASLIGEIDPYSGFLTYQATSPSVDAFSYQLWDTAAGGTFVRKSTGQFTATAITLESLKPEVTSTIGINPEANVSSIALNTYALIDDEIVSVTALSASSITINRGVLDTVPVSHPMASVIWFADRHQANDTTEWAEGVVVQARALPQTGKGTLALEAAPIDALTMKRRWYRPYAPGNVQLNGARWPTTTQVGDLVFTWSHRDRTTQLSYYVNQAEGNFGPEAGVTYTARVYSRTGELKRTVTGITEATWTYDSAMESVDVPGSLFLVTLAAVRGGVESYQAQQVLVFRLGIGYGYNYGNFYGGWNLSEGFGNQYGRFYGRFVA